MILIKNLFFSYGANKVFEDISLNIYREDKIGLIGINGSGKTTLLKLLSGELKPEKGEIIFEGNVSIGYIPQEINFGENETPRSLCYKAFEYEKKLIEKFEKISLKLEKDFNNENLHNEYDKILNEINERDAFNLNYKIENILFNLGFDKETIDLELKYNSGGFKVRAYIGYLLLINKDLILLDEPTNYLDIDSIIFLTEYLKSYKKAFILISHDTEFLNNTINRVLYLNNFKIYDFPNSNYYDFLKRKEELIDRIRKNNENRLKKIEQLQTFVDRFRAKNTLATRVQSKMKMIDKLKEELNDINFKEKEVNFVLKENKNRFLNILSFEGVSFSYDKGKNIIENISFSITRDDKILLVGKNGIGKTTLLKLAARVLSPQTGNVLYHNNAKFGYFSQDLKETLNLENEVIEEFEKEDFAKELNDTEKRNYLGIFGFEKNDVFNKVKFLSGGEKVRLLISKIFLNSPDILILDEPTTYLDIQSKEILSNCVNNYNGSVLMVSHDIDFIKRVSNTIWTIEDKKIKKLKNIEEYLFFKKNNLFNYSESKSQNLNQNYSFDNSQVNFSIKGINNYNKNIEKGKKNIWNSEKDKEKKREIIEKEILTIENKIKEIELNFLNHKWDEKFIELNKEYNLLKDRLKYLEDEWINL